MEGCLYTYNGKDYLSLEQIVEAYYKDGALLTNKNIYSSEEIAASTVKRIIKNVNTNVRLKEHNDKKPLTTFISQENSAIAKQLGRENTRFAPEYDKNSRILSFIKNKLIEENLASSNDLDFDRKSLKDLEIEFAETSKFKEIILKTLESEEKTQELMAGFKNAIFSALEDMDNITSMDSFLNRKLKIVINKAIESNLLEESNSSDMLNRLVVQASKIINTVSNYGEPIVDILITTEPGAMAQIVGHIDIITVDGNGDSHIFSIRSSKENYGNWDSAKRLDTDYRLAFQRALLGQYVNIANTGLTIIPVSIGELINGKIQPLSFTVDTLQHRDSDPYAGLIYGKGELFLNANAVIPSLIHLDHNPERVERINLELETLLPDYDVRTSSRKFIKELAIKSILRSNSFTADLAAEFMLDSSNSKTIEKYGIEKHDNILTVKKDITPEEANELLDYYLKFADGFHNQSMILLKTAINSVIKNEDVKSIKMHNDKQSNYVSKVLAFLNDSYRLLNTTRELDELGIVLLQNTKTGKIVVINISANNYEAKNQDQIKYKELEQYKIFTVLNNFYDELNLKIHGIEQIIIMDIDSKTAAQPDLINSFNRFKELAVKKSYKLKFNESILPSLQDTIHQVLFSQISNSEGELYNIFGGIKSNILDTDIDTLLRIYREMRSKFPKLTEKTLTPEINFTDPIEYIYTLVNILLLTKRGLMPKGDVVGLRSFALGFEDWFGVIQAFYSKNLPEFNSKGDKITGVLGSLEMITPDKVASEDLREIYGIISGSIDMIRHEILDRAQRVQISTRNFYKKKQYGGFADQFVGNHRKIFKDLWVHEGDKISNKWSVKNPYDLNVPMLEEDRQYLKEILFHIQRQLLEIPAEIANKIDFSTLESIKKTSTGVIGEKILKAIHTNDYFRMPLIRSTYINRNKGLLSLDTERWVNSFRNFFNEARDIIDPGDLKPDQRRKIDEVMQEYYQMYDIYGDQSVEFIANSVDRDGPNNWEIDLDTIAHEVIQAKVKKKYINNVLPVINSYIWWVKYSGGIQNRDVTKVIEAIKKRIDISFFDKSAVDREFEDVITVASSLKKATTVGMLAFRPVFLFKEGIIGLYKGISIAATKYFGKDQFTVQDYMRAMKELTVIDNKFSTIFNKIDILNETYGFANMDINSYSKKIRTNRRGLMMGLSPYMYMSNTLPDYYNRLSLFLAKMINDGSYDAHIMQEDGTLKYYPDKDKRFSYYLANRHRYTNQVVGAKNKYIPAKNDEKYNFQRNHYLLVMEEMNKSRRLVGDAELVEEDFLPLAYSEKERNSYKTFTDTVYGYYDKESAPSWHYAWYGIVFLQFMQFWPGKMSVWFSNPIKDVGTKMVQKIGIDEKTGKKVLMWRKVIIGENGEITITPTTENTGDPLLEWKGGVHEGVIFSFAKTLQTTIRDMGFEGKSWAETKEDILKDDENRLNRVKYGFADGILMYIVLLIFKSIFDSMFEDETVGIGNEVRKFGNSVNTKILAEANVPQNTIFAIKGEFLPWTYGSKVIRDLNSTINGDKTISQSLSNFRMLESLNDPTRR